MGIVCVSERQCAVNCPQEQFVIREFRHGLGYGRFGFGLLAQRLFQALELLDRLVIHQHTNKGTDACPFTRSGRSDQRSDSR